MTIGDTVKIARMPKGIHGVRRRFKIGSVGVIRNIYGTMAYVYFGRKYYAVISVRNLEVVRGGENRGKN